MPNSSSHKRFHVAVLMDVSRTRGRSIARGIAQAVHEHYDWNIYFHVGEIGDSPPSWFNRWKGDGVIARLEHPGIIQPVLDKGVPVVDVRGTASIEHVPIVRTDDDAVAELAFRHLIDCEFRRFAFCGYPGADFSDRRHHAFAARVKELGSELHVFSPGKGKKEPPNYHFRDVEYLAIADEDDLVKWIKSLPKPIGMFVSEDVRALRVTNICREFDIAVPEEMAVIGVGNCDVLCQLSEPHLSSIEHDTDRIGQFAVNSLEQMMTGHTPTDFVKLIEPSRLVARQSTDVLAIADKDIIRAAQYIRQNACNGINVNDILNAVPISRRELERRYVKALRRTPKEEILRVRIERIKQLLSQTDLPIYNVARKSGFDSSGYMSTAFKKRTGLTPGEYRERNGASISHLE